MSATAFPDRSPLRASLIGWLLLAVASAGAQTPLAPAAAARPVKILFVGNSFSHGKFLPVRTYNAQAITDENAGLPAGDPRAFHPDGESGPYGGIPGIFKKLADEAGLNYEVHAELVSAKDLAFHEENALPVITRPGWDVVILQGYSTEPLPVGRGGKPEGFQNHAIELERAIHAVNPHAKVYLEETWPRADLVYPEAAPYHGDSVAAMTADLHAACRRTFDLGNFERVIEVGDAWQRAMNEGVALKDPYQPPETGKLDLWGTDHYHPSVYGAYLSAVVILGNVIGNGTVALPPEEQAAHDLGISPADAMHFYYFGLAVTHFGVTKILPDSSTKIP